VTDIRSIVAIPVESLADQQGEISGFVVQCEGSGGKKGHVVIDNDAIVAAVDGRSI
jgi:hypothetical protein